MFKLTTDDTEGQTQEITQSLDELAREGARRMIAAALEVEVAQYVEALGHHRDENGHALTGRSEREVVPRTDSPDGSRQHQGSGASGERSAERPQL